MPAALCHFEQLVRADKLAEAKNVFWDEVHFTAHVLAADLQRNDRVEAGRFLVAKGAVERDLATLAPGLKIDSLAFVTETRRAMGAARVPGRERSC